MLNNNNRVPNPDFEKKSLIQTSEKEGSAVALDDLEKRKADKLADRLISEIKLAFENKEEFELLFGILNSTGEYLRKLLNKEKHQVEESTRKAIWNKIKKDLAHLNRKQRQKLQMALAILKKLNVKISEKPPPDTYLNGMFLKDIYRALSLFDLEDGWFNDLGGMPCSKEELYIFAFGTGRALLHKHINYKTTWDKIAHCLGFVIAFATASGVGVAAYFGCTKLLLGSLAIIAVPLAGIALGIATFVLINAIGKTADHHNWGRNIGILIALGILITFCILPFISFPLPVLTMFAQMGIGALSIITFSVNYLIYSIVSPRFTTRVFRGETFKKDNGKIMSWPKIGAMFAALVGATLVGFTIGILFLYLSNPSFQISILAFFGICACVGAFFGYFLILFENTLSAARAPNGLKGAFKKLFAPAFETFKDYKGKKKWAAWGITAVLCGGIIYGAASLGMAQAVALNSFFINVCHWSPELSSILGHILGSGVTTTLLLPFYIGAAITCVGLLFKYSPIIYRYIIGLYHRFLIFLHIESRNDKKKESLSNLSDKIKGREVVLWKNDSSNDFSQLQDKVLGIRTEKDSKDDASAESQPVNKAIIITAWQESSWIIFIEINDVMISIIVSEGKDKENKFYNAIGAYSEGESVVSADNLKDHIYKFCISMDRSWFLDILNSAVTSRELVLLNAFVNASFVPGGDITHISSNLGFVGSATGCQGLCSAAAGFAGGRLASQSEYRYGILNDIIKELFPDLPSQIHRNSSGASSNYADALKMSGSPVISTDSIDTTDGFSRERGDVLPVTQTL